MNSTLMLDFAIISIKCWNVYEKKQASKQTADILNSAGKKMMIEA